MGNSISNFSCFAFNIVISGKYGMKYEIFFTPIEEVNYLKDKDLFL